MLSSCCPTKCRDSGGKLLDAARRPAGGCTSIIQCCKISGPDHGPTPRRCAAPSKHTLRFEARCSLPHVLASRRPTPGRGDSLMQEDMAVLCPKARMQSYADLLPGVAVAERVLLSSVVSCRRSTVHGRTTCPPPIIHCRPATPSW